MYFVYIRYKYKRTRLGWQETKENGRVPSRHLAQLVIDLDNDGEPWELPEDTKLLRCASMSRGRLTALVYCEQLPRSSGVYLPVVRSKADWDRLTVRKLMADLAEL